MYKWRGYKKKLIKKPVANVGVKDVWGKVVLFLKEHRHVALHVACGDITDIDIKDGVLQIITPDKTVMSLLQEGKREIERALSWQGLELGVDIKEKEILPSTAQQDEEVLIKMFGNKVKIIK